MKDKDVCKAAGVMKNCIAVALTARDSDPMIPIGRWGGFWMCLVQMVADQAASVSCQLICYICFGHVGCFGDSADGNR